MPRWHDWMRAIVRARLDAGDREDWLDGWGTEGPSGLSGGLLQTRSLMASVRHDVVGQSVQLSSTCRPSGRAGP